MFNSLIELCKVYLDPIVNWMSQYSGSATSYTDHVVGLVGIPLVLIVGSILYLTRDKETTVKIEDR